MGVSFASEGPHGLSVNGWVGVIRLMLHRRHGRDGWTVFDEMRLGTGAAFDRTIDVFAMGVWPSLHYQRVAYEIKVSRQDALREFANVDKWKPWFDATNEFWYVTLPGVCDPSEVPEGCGLMEAQKSRLVVKRQAQARAPGEMSNKLIAAFVARCYGTDNIRRQDVPYVRAINLAGKWLSHADLEKELGRIQARRCYACKRKPAPVIASELPATVKIHGYTVNTSWLIHVAHEIIDLFPIPDRTFAGGTAEEVFKPTLDEITNRLAAVVGMKPEATRYVGQIRAAADNALRSLRAVPTRCAGVVARPKTRRKRIPWRRHR